MEENFLGIRGISGNLEAGVGFVIIPENVDKNDYKNDVYQTGRISIFGGYGHSNFYNILIDRGCIQRIKFPKKVGEMGSPVVWINIPKHNEPVIIACLKYDEDYYSISEDRRRITTSHKGNIVDLDLDAKNGKIIISGRGEIKPIEFNLNLSDKNANAIFKAEIDGNFLLRVLKRFVIISEKFEFSTTDKSGVVKSKLKGEFDGESPSLSYEDINENKILINKDKIEIRADKSSEINLGGGKEKIVLGDTLKKLLDKYDDAISKLTVPTAFGPSGTPINYSEFLSVRKEFSTFLSKLSNTD